MIRAERLLFDLQCPLIKRFRFGILMSRLIKLAEALQARRGFRVVLCKTRFAALELVRSKTLCAALQRAWIERLCTRVFARLIVESAKVVHGKCGRGMVRSKYLLANLHRAFEKRPGFRVFGSIAIKRREIVQARRSVW